MLDHSLTNYLVAFWGGVLSAATPCVYPLIPVTVALFSSSSNSSKFLRFMNSLGYSLGIAVTYTLMGFIAVKTNSIFGSFQSNIFVVLFFSVVLFLLLLISLDLYHPRAIAKLQNIGDKYQVGSFFGAFMAGAASSFVAAPCIGPALGVALGFAASTKDLFVGTMILFSYSLGFSLPFLFLTFFSNLLDKLPKSGNWLYITKSVISIALGAYLFFLTTPITRVYPFLLTSRLGSVATISLIIFTFSILFSSYKYDKSSSKLLSTLICGFLLLGFFTQPDVNETVSSAKLTWSSDLDKAKATSLEQKKIIMVDFFAEWCAACLEFDKFTFSSTIVKEDIARRFVPVRFDMTNDNELVNSIAANYQVLGLPTILFVDGNGEEIPDSRILGFIGEKEFLSHLEKVYAKSPKL